MMKKIYYVLSLILIFGLTPACNQSGSSNNQEQESTDEHMHSDGESHMHDDDMQGDMGTEMNANVTKAKCVLYPTEGNDVNGTVTFTKTDQGIEVTANVTGLTEGKHGFHIHEKGDCSASDGTSAGGHFNPEGVKHGGPEAMERHIGDLGNLEANSEGVATLSYVDPHLSFEGEHSIIGRGIIVHADEDDLTSQPTGAAGARVACGVIETD